MHAKADGRAVDGVPMPAPYDRQRAVGCGTSAPRSAPDSYDAMRDLSYLGTPAARAIYAESRFVEASDSEP